MTQPFLFLTIYCTCLYSQSASTAPFPLRSDSIVNLWLSENKIPAIGIGLIDNYKITHIKVYGHLAEGRPAPDNAIFKVASLTKPIVSMIALELINQGELHLGDKLSEYWIDPDLVSNPLHQLLTVKHVLTHQTGFKNWRRLKDNGVLDFDFKPGTRFQYSGEGYEYLRIYLEKRFNATIENIAQNLIFGPLDMTDTKFSWSEYVDTTRYAKNHDKEGLVIPTRRNLEANGANHLLSTVEDYSKFAQYILTGANLSEDLYEEMTTRQVEVNEHSDFGLGWEIVPDFVKGTKVIMHSGADPGVSSLVVLNPHYGKGVILLSNSDNGGWQYWSDIVNAAFE